MLTRVLLFLAGVCVSVETAKVTDVVASPDVIATRPASELPADVKTQILLTNSVTTATDVTPRADTATSTRVKPPASISQSSSPALAPVGTVPRAQPRLLKLPQQQERLFPPQGWSQCSPPTATHYLTVTTTHIVPSVSYATSINYIPTVISQELTEWSVITSTVALTQTFTAYAIPHLITSTQVLTAPKYVTQVKHHSHIKYITSTVTRTYTDTVAEVAVDTRTRVVTATTTTTATHYATSTFRQTVLFTDTRFQYVTKTKNVPQYVVQTLTSPYPVYETVTHYSTEDEYITKTSVHISTIFVTSCSSMGPGYTQMAPYAYQG